MPTTRADATSLQTYARIAGILFLISMVSGGFGEDVALLAAFFGLVSTAVFAVCELFYFAPSFILGGADYLNTFSPDQLNTLSLLSLQFYGYGGMIFLGFYGIATSIRAYLIYQSGYLPRFLGALMGLAGVGFILKNLTTVLAPAYASDFFVLPMMVSGLTFTVWLLVKGVDARKLEASAVMRG